MTAAWVAARILGPLLLAVATVSLHKHFKKVSGRTLAILGERQSGKTTLTRLMSQGILGDPEYIETVADTSYAGATTTLPDGTVLHVGDLKDLPGDESAWLPWRNRVQESHHVIYLLRSPQLRTGRSTARNRCRRDLQQIAIWIEEANSEERGERSVVLVFSHRDLDTDQSANTNDYAHGLIEAADLTAAVTTLRRAARVNYVAGSLHSQEAANSLLQAIVKAL